MFELAVSERKFITDHRKQIILRLAGNLLNHDAVLEFLKIQGIFARKPYVYMTAAGIKVPNQFELHTDYLEFYRSLTSIFSNSYLNKILHCFEEDKIEETGEIPNSISQEYLEQHLLRFLKKRDHKNLRSAIVKQYGDCYAGSAILDDFMERTIRPRNTSVRIRKAYKYI